MSNTVSHHVIGPDSGEVLGPPEGVRDRFLVGHDETAGRFALVEHLLAPHALAAPVHRHSREDEYSFVVSGVVGIALGDDVVTVRPGDLVYKPRGQWHTFWNAGDQPARMLDTISPGGLEELFRPLDLMPEFPGEDTLTRLAADYGCDLDFGATAGLVERLDLRF
ncbi:MAG TPA: cupin domain-containing protein [Aldersonia sp.]